MERPISLTYTTVHLISNVRLLGKSSFNVLRTIENAHQRLVMVEGTAASSR